MTEEIEVHGYKMSGRCEFCDKNKMTSCFIWKDKPRQACRDCLEREFNIKKTTIFKFHDNEKAVCTRCIEKELISTEVGFLCLSCGKQFHKDGRIILRHRKKKGE